jgi:hypothetical protein
MGGSLEKTALCLEKFVTFGDETVWKGGNVTICCQGIELLKGNCIGTVVVDDGVAVVDEKCTGCHEVARLDVPKSVIVKFVMVGGPRKRGN